ncbi:MAG: hypothetical protein KAU90_12025 [Sulfurovaceae bacterium]|nr:hypothetical protein [Sulfurovaceae bacterium]
MRKIILLSIVTTGVVFATNGDNLIGVGTKSRGMGELELELAIVLNRLYKILL